MSTRKQYTAVQEAAASFMTDDTDARTVTGIRHYTELIKEAEQQRRRYIEAARSMGDSWSEIGAAMGISKQAAQQKYGKLPTHNGEPVQANADSYQ